MAQTSGFDPTTKVKTCFDCKMFDVANWVACLNRENGPGGRPSHEALSVSYPSAETIFAHLDWWQNPTNVIRGAGLHPKDHSIQLFTDASNEGWGAHSEQTYTKGLWSDREKRLHINDVHSPMEDHDMVPSLPDNIKSQTHPRVSECDGRPSVQVAPSAVNRMVTASASVPSDLSKVVHYSFRSICHSSEPQTSTVCVSRPKCLGHRCSEHKLDGSHCLCLPSPTALLHRVIHKIRQCHCLIIIIAPG